MNQQLKQRLLLKIDATMGLLQRSHDDMMQSLVRRTGMAAEEIVKLQKTVVVLKRRMIDVKKQKRSLLSTSAAMLTEYPVSLDD
jgi:hypothetical protein